MARYAPGLPDEPFWNRSRVASLGILVLYVVLRIGSRPGELDGLAIGGLAAAVIWFPEFFADYTGRLLSSAPAITKRTPAGCLLVIAWFVLALPLLWALVARGRGH
jgi:hypothetical protein